MRPKIHFYLNFLKTLFYVFHPILGAIYKFIFIKKSIIFDFIHFFIYIFKFLYILLIINYLHRQKRLNCLIFICFGYRFVFQINGDANFTNFQYIYLYINILSKTFFPYIFFCRRLKKFFSASHKKKHATIFHHRKARFRIAV